MIKNEGKMKNKKVKNGMLIDFFVNKDAEEKWIKIHIYAKI